MAFPTEAEKRQSTLERAELLRVYAEQDAVFGSPNPRYKQCKLYCDRYLDIRIQLVGIDGLTDTDWDLTIF
jgi:hypothetical protein